LPYDGDVAELEASARRELAQGPPAGPPVGTDASESVWITLDDDFHVERIEVSRQWKDRLDSGQFAPALFQAYQDGIARRIRAQAFGTVAADGDSGAPAMPTLPDYDDPNFFRRLQEEADGTTGRLETLQREAAQGSRDEQHDRELTSPEEIFTIRLQGTTIVGITGDLMKIRRGNPELLRLEALDLFKAAGLTAATSAERK
jgi:hypothetical protein